MMYSRAWLLFVLSTTAGGWTASLSAAKTSIPASSAAHITSTISAPVSTITANAPPVGSIPRDYSPAGLERLWDIVGSIEPPPFTTTRVPTSTKIQLPASPPPLYPSFFSPAPKDILPHLKFPPGFKFGIDTAAFQVEGAAKSEGKGPTMWDWCGHLPGCIFDNSTGDIVDLQYFLYKEDVVRVAALGITAHSFSISWARIFPFGAADSPLNKQGLQHYSDLIDYHWEQGERRSHKSLVHWDVPLALLAHYGGFTSPKIVDDFVHYAKTVFKAYNGRIKTWYTFNEPRVFCAFFIDPPFSNLLAPGVNASMAPYVCTYNLMKAHTATVKAFREMGISGEIGFKSDDFIGVPWRANSTEDALAVERHAAFRIGAFADPAYTTGDWPKILTDTLPPDYLPRFTPQEIKDNLGTADFFATDCYRSQYVVAPAEGIDACVANSSHPLWPECHDVVLFDSSNAGWAVGVSADPRSSWLQATPNTLRGLLKGLHTRWPSKKMYVSEFGMSEPFEWAWTDLFRITARLFFFAEDVARTNYYMTYLGEIMLSIHEDGVPISGAFAWAMLDNLEWNDGIRTRFGIQYVNYTTLERVYKRSAFALGAKQDKSFMCDVAVTPLEFQIVPSLEVDLDGKSPVQCSPMIEWSTPARRSGHRSLSLIPNEVYLEIFAYLEPRDGYGTLDASQSNQTFVNLSRVCRFFCAASLTALYRRVRFSARNEDHTTRTRGMNPDALCALLVRRPPRDAMDTFGRSSASEIEWAKMIASWVRECVFDGWAEPRGRIPYAHLFLERNWRAMRSMSGLTALTLRSTPVTKALLRTLSALSGTLKRLSLRACAFKIVLTDKQIQWLDSLRLDVLEVFETFESWEDIPLEAIRLKDVVEFRTDSWPYAEHFLKSSYSRLRCLELHDVSDIPLLLRFLEKTPTLHALTVQSIMTDHSETPRVELDSETLPQLDALTVPPMLLQVLSRGTVRTLSLLGEESHLYDEEIGFFPTLRALTETDLASLFRSEAPAAQSLSELDQPSPLLRSSKLRKAP
ncbi:unnamed protein product [Mycena citricolor]|uniref:F-box domain-containing protein n=1 Tax=Mycena citricolor TaxID=2018698 RepID=A0AAD2HKQ1_9AGAR|nr:unnamed protein product [Mycena citricolor]